MWKQSELAGNHLVSRFNACVVVQGLLFAFAVKPVLTMTVTATFWERIVGFVVASGGILFSWFSLRVLRGAYFWVGYWEYRLTQIDEKIFPNIEVFRNLPHADNKKEDAAKRAENKKRLRKLAEEAPHLRYCGSSREAMVNIFYIFLATWIILLLVVVVQWVSNVRPNVAEQYDAILHWFRCLPCY